MNARTPPDPKPPPLRAGAAPPPPAAERPSRIPRHAAFSTIAPATNAPAAPCPHAESAKGAKEPAP